MGLRDQFILASSIARVGTVIAKEKLRPTELDLSSVPVRVENLTEDWLTAALCRDHPGARVTGFEVFGASEGTASRRSLRVEYNGAGVAAGLPTAVFSKSAPRFISRLL